MILRTGTNATGLCRWKSVVPGGSVLKKVILLVCLLLSTAMLFALETFESQVFSKEIQQVYGNGALSVATNVYSIMVLNKDVYMRIEVPQKAFDVLKVGDGVRITFEKGLFYNEIKGITLIRPTSPKKE